MFRCFVAVWFFLYGLTSAFAFVRPPISTLTGAVTQPYRYTPNVGQFNSYLRFKCEIPGGELFLNRNSIFFHFIDYEALHQITHEHASSKVLNNTLVKVTFVNGNADAPISYLDAFSDPSHYFIGADSSKWHRNVWSYKKVQLTDMYPGIDVVYYSQNEALKYDIVLHRGSNPDQIVLSYAGMQQLQLREGALYWQTGNGAVVEQQPLAYQVIGGVRRSVSCRYRLNGTQVRFVLGAYNPNFDVVIDPRIVFSSYSGSKADNFGYTATYNEDKETFVGGIVFNYNAIFFCTDPFGNPADCNDALGMPIDSFPVSPGAYQTRFNGGFSDVVIFKFSADGKRRLYATYLGGSRTEIPQSMVVNSNNQLIVFGSTSSTDFPVTSGVLALTGSGSSFEVNCNGLQFNGGSQVYITVFNDVGTGLEASALIRTQGNSGINYTDPVVDFNPPINPSYYNFGDEARGEVLVDKFDNIIVATSTEATQIPGETAPKTKAITDKTDAWVFKLNPQLSQFIFSRRYGGSFDDVAYGLQPDSLGNLFVTGYTLSADMPGTLTGAAVTPFGALDGYVLKLDGTGNPLAFTYIGTPANDQCFFVQTNLANEVFVMGQTWSSSFPIQANGSPFYADGASGQFICKLNNSLSGILFSTTFGSGELGPDISPTAFLVDNCGLIYVSGWRGKLDEPSVKIAGRRLRTTVDNEWNPISASGFYFAIFESEMRGLFGGYYFGNDAIDHVDGGTSRFDKRGYIHQAICGGCRGTNSTPTTPDVWSPVNRSANCNMVGVKYDFETADIKAAFTSTPPLKNDTIRVTYGQSIDFAFNGRTVLGSNVSWYNYRYPSVNRNNLRFISEEPKWTALPVQPLPTFMSLRKWLVEVDYAKSETCIQTDNQSFYVVVEPSISGANICNGDSGQFQVIGSVRSAIWTPENGLSLANIPNPKVIASTDTFYTVTLAANDNSYTGRYKVPVNVVNYQILPAFGFTTDTVAPFPHTVFISNQTEFIGAVGGYTWDMGDGTTLTGANPGYTYSKIGRYTIKMRVNGDAEGCPAADSATARVYVTPRVSETLYCPESPFGSLSISGGVFCLWSSPSATYQVQKSNSCVGTFTFVGTSVQPTALVYSELNQPYSYIFTVSGSASAFTPIVYAFDTSTQRETDNIIVRFTGKTRVRTRTWDTGNQQTYLDSVFKTTYTRTDQYPIIITGIDTNGCRYRTEWPLNIALMQIPNVFTPNNDGVNDTFEILGANPSKTTLRVYNRWGTLVYDSGLNQYANSWRAPGLSDGVYYYTLFLDHASPREYKGWVQIIR